MAKKRNNTLTLTYNVQRVTKMKGYKEMRDRVAAATGLSYGEISSIMAPAYGEFDNWLQQRKLALAAYEAAVIQQTLAMLNNKGSEVSDLVAAANATTSERAAPVVEEEEVVEEASLAKRAVTALAKYKKDHDLTLKALSEMMGTSMSTLHHWLSKGATPQADNANKLAAWLGSQGYPVSR